MFFKKKPQARNIKMPANLNRKQQREIKAVVERAKKDNGIPQTAQQSIPFQRMFPDGICRVTDSYYTKTIQFQDINYQLAQQEDKTAIFDEWCSFLNFFDSSIHFELSFMNLSTDAESFEKSIRIPFKKDSFNPVRAEYSQMFQNGGETLYYGLNALSNNLIMVDRKKLKNPNGLILGTPGSGKSFSAKREITNAFLVTDDDIIICDPEAEYAALVHKFNGQVVKISSSSTNYINPMDINLNYSEDDNPVALKADFILSLCELIMGSKDGLQPIEKTVIDRCVHQIYQRYFDNPAPENMPILEDRLWRVSGLD